MKTKKHINLFSQHGRLRQARLSAGFKTATSACRQFGWDVLDVRAHESGRTKITNEAAASYAKAYGVDVSFILHDTDFKKVFELRNKIERNLELKKKPKILDKPKFVQLRVDLDDPDKKVELLVHQWVPFEMATKVIDLLRSEGR